MWMSLCALCKDKAFVKTKLVALQRKSLYDDVVSKESKMIHPLTIGVLNLKGGVGKSTIATHLAVQASLDARWNLVALIDCDPQGSANHWHAIGGRTSPEIMINEETPSDAVEKLGLQGYEVAIMDGSPAFLNVIEDAIAACDLVVIPLRASDFDVESSSETVMLCKGAGTPYLLVINEARSAKDAKAGSMIAKFKEIGEPVYSEPLRHRAAYSDACNAGKSVAEYKGKKWHEAAQEIGQLYKEVVRLSLEARGGSHERR